MRFFTSIPLTEHKGPGPQSLQGAQGAPSGMVQSRRVVRAH